MKKNITAVKRVDPDYFVIAATGGPCGGKTVLVDKIRKYSFAMPNVKIVIANEAATTIHNSEIGFKDCRDDPSKPNGNKNNYFQNLIVEEQLHSENRARYMAKKWKAEHRDDVVIVVCDRGIMDVEAYFDSSDDFQKFVLSKHGLDREKAYERYDMVIHMRSVAVDRPEFYQTNDGTPRDEDAATAKKLDKKVSNAWAKHPNHVVIDNKSNVYDKLNKAMGVIFNFCGIEIPHEYCERFIVDIPDFSHFNKLGNIVFSRSRTFFIGDNHRNSYSAVKMCSNGNVVSYYFSEQRWETMPDNNNRYAAYDMSMSITAEVFLSKLLNLTPNIKPLSKFMYTFIIEDNIFCKLDIYSCNSSKAYLRVYTNMPDGEAVMQKVNEYFTGVHRVTYCEEYNEYNISKTDGNVLNV